MSKHTATVLLAGAGLAALYLHNTDSNNSRNQITQPSYESKVSDGSCAVSLQLVKEQMITESIARYPGPCPCPEFRDSAGRKCGKRSAWSKPGGYSPLCYLSDISDKEAQSFCSSIRFNRG